MQSKEEIQKSYENLKELLLSIEKDLLKNLSGNKAAGSRARRSLRLVKKQAAEIVKAMIELEKQE